MRLFSKNSKVKVTQKPIIMIMILFTVKWEFLRKVYAVYLYTSTTPWQSNFDKVKCIIMYTYCNPQFINFECLILLFCVYVFYGLNVFNTILWNKDAEVKEICKNIIEFWIWIKSTVHTKCAVFCFLCCATVSVHPAAFSKWGIHRYLLCILSEL